MSIIVNTINREEYNNKINYYKANGFKVKSASSMNIQTHLEKKNFGPSWVVALLITSLIGSIIYLSELVLYPLAISDLFIKLNFFSLVLATQYLRDFGLILLILFVVMLILSIYYYLAKPYEIIIRLNQNTNQNVNYNGMNSSFNPNGGGNFNG